ncbi:MAG: NAD(P)H-hydrate epimerase [Planctomycetota bacterium]|jgi:NAD(P)H-hydrate epimerase
MESLSRQEVRDVDRAAIERLGLPGIALMENAGRQAADLAERMLPGGGGRVAVVAGAGNNGGDGFVLARHLLLRGVSVDVYLVAPPNRLSGDALINYQVLRRLGVAVRYLCADKLTALANMLAGADLVVDAIGGTGISGPLRGPAAEAVLQINAANADILAMDIPTGLNCDTGGGEYPIVRATATITFVAPKKGVDSPDTVQYTGRLHCADIGVSGDVGKQ